MRKKIPYALESDIKTAWLTMVVRTDSTAFGSEFFWQVVNEKRNDGTFQLLPEDVKTPVAAPRLISVPSE